MNRISIILSVLSVFLLSNLMFSAPQFKVGSDIFFWTTGKFDISNEMVNVAGTGQYYLQSTGTFMKVNLFPTVTDKGLLASVKLIINPYSTGNDYLKADGFNLAYTSESLGINIFVNRFGYRPNDPMMLGMEYWEGDYVSALYDMPVVFSYNNSVINPQFYTLTTNDNRYYRLGKDLVGAFIEYKGDLSLSIGGFINPNYSNSVLLANAGYTLELDDSINLVFGLIGKLDSHSANDTNQTYGHNTNYLMVINGLSQRYTDYFSSVAYGGYARFNIVDLLGVFAEVVSYSKNGKPGYSTNESTSSQLDIFGGAAFSIMENNSVEATILYRTVSNASRMDITVKDITSIELDEGFGINLSAVYNYFSDSILLNSADKVNGMFGVLSMAMPFNILDLPFNLRIAGAFNDVAVGTNTNSYIMSKAVIDVEIFDNFTLYGGIGILSVLNNNQSTNAYFNNQSSFLLPLVGITFKPSEFLSVKLVMNYPANVYGYDNDSASLESQYNMGQSTKLINSIRYRTFTEWFTASVNPTINLGIDLKF